MQNENVDMKRVTRYSLNVVRYVTGTVFYFSQKLKMQSV